MTGGAYAEAVREKVTALDAAEALGLSPDRHGRCACPVHGGRNRNLKLDGDVWYCHKCHAGGDVIGLVKAVNGCGFIDALRWLDAAFALGLDIDKPADKKTQEAARNAAERRRKEREMKRALDGMQKELALLAGDLAAALDRDAERYAPVFPEAEWDERFRDAVDMRTEAVACEDWMRGMNHD